MDRDKLVSIILPILTLIVSISLLIVTIAIFWYHIPPPSWDFATRSVAGSIVVFVAAVLGYLLKIRNTRFKIVVMILIALFIVLPTYIFQTPTEPAEPVIRITHPANYRW